MCSTDQPTHCSFYIPFSRDGSFIPRIIGEHDDIFLFVPKSFCSSGTFFSIPLRTRRRRTIEASKMKARETERKMAGNDMKRERGHTNQELLDIGSIIDTSSQFPFLTKVVDPNLLSVIVTADDRRNLVYE